MAKFKCGTCGEEFKDGHECEQGKISSLDKPENYPACFDSCPRSCCKHFFSCQIHWGDSGCDPGF